MRGNIVEILSNVIAKNELKIQRHKEAITQIEADISTLKEVIANEQKKQQQKR